MGSIESHTRIAGHSGTSARAPGLRGATAHAPRSPGANGTVRNNCSGRREPPDCSSEGEDFKYLLPVLSSQALAAFVDFGVSYKSTLFLSRSSSPPLALPASYCIFFGWAFDLSDCVQSGCRGEYWFFWRSGTFVYVVLEPKVSCQSFWTFLAY